jgi:hypothetical protein
LLLNVNYQPYLNQTKSISFSQNQPEKTVLNAKRITCPPVGENFWMVNDSALRGGQPGIDENRNGSVDKQVMKQELRNLWGSGVRVILNLRSPKDNPTTKHIEMERDAVREINEENGIKLVNIEMDSSFGIESEQAKQIFLTFQNIPKSENSKSAAIYWHCRSGNDRTGMVGALYRIWSDPNAKFDDICQEMKECGHNPDGMFKNPIPSLAACIKYMATTGHDKFKDLKNSEGKTDFIYAYYLKNQKAIDKRIPAGW